MKNNGFTLIELIVGIAACAVLSLVVAGIMRAGLYTSNYSLRQTLILANSRKAIEGDGRLLGMAWALQESQAVRELSPAGLDLAPASGSSVQYASDDGALTRTELGVTRRLAQNISSIEARYYALDEQGYVRETADASSAVMVTTLVAMKSPNGRTYVFFSGAQLRNHP